jgi:hypothetical protein
MTSLRSRRVAIALWIAFAVVVWNVVLDQVIVLAGRAYIVAAVEAAERLQPYVRMEDWMGPAVVRGFWMANASAALIFIIGAIAFRYAR